MELIDKRFKPAITMKITDFVKRNFGGTWPIDTGMVAVVHEGHRGATCDLLLDAPGAYSVASTDQYQTLRAGATLDYSFELERIALVPGTSIWSDDQCVYVGTAGKNSGVLLDGKAKVLDPVTAIVHWLNDWARGTYGYDPRQVSIGFNDTKKTMISGIGVNSGWMDTPWFGTTCHLLQLVWLGNYNFSNGAVVGEYFTAASEADVLALAGPGYSIVYSSGSALAGGGQVVDPRCGAEFGAVVGDQYTPSVRGRALVDINVAAGKNGIAFYGYRFPGVWGMPSVQKFDSSSATKGLEGSYVVFGTSHVKNYFSAAPLIQKSMSEVGAVYAGSKIGGWADIASLWPSIAQYNTVYPSGTTIESFSPVRALPQLEVDCGLESSVLVSPHMSLGWYTFEHPSGIPVKVIVVSEADWYVGVPLEWLKDWSLRHPDEVKEEAVATIDEAIANNPDTVIVAVQYFEPVMLEANLVDGTVLHQEYAEAREKACKPDDFMDKEFSRFHTYGSLEVLMNGSRNTREFFSTRRMDAYLEYSAKGGLPGPVSIVVAKTNSVITGVTLTGGLSGYFTSPSGEIGEAILLGATITGATKLELTDWLGKTAELSAAQSEWNERKATMSSTMSATPRRTDNFEFQDYLINYGGFPDWKRVNLISAETAKHLAMVSKGAVKIGPTMMKLLQNIRGIK